MVDWSERELKKNLEVATCPEAMPQRTKDMFVPSRASSGRDVQHLRDHVGPTPGHTVQLHNHPDSEPQQGI